jgi:signal transduction histidine kinase
LAAPLPRPALDLRIAQAVHVTDPDTAETLLRIVQEALTNSARHADADRLRVSLDAEADGLRIHIEDDGRLKGTLREGNGLCGMRERVHAHGGRLRLVPSPTGALCIDAWLPGVATANTSGATPG